MHATGWLLTPLPRRTEPAFLPMTSRVLRGSPGERARCPVTSNLAIPAPIDRGWEKKRSHHGHLTEEDIALPRGPVLGPRDPVLRQRPPDLRRETQLDALVRSLGTVGRAVVEGDPIREQRTICGEYRAP